MSTVYESPRNGGPQTHALVLGVGRYPHLIGGDGQGAKIKLGLKQLTSPPLSATAFANWLLDEYDNPDAPLGSLELLLSPGPFVRAGGQTETVDPATTRHLAGWEDDAGVHVDGAFDRWAARCDGHEDDVAVFYFCGHGLRSANTLLLLEDFGLNPNRPFERAVNLEVTAEGMRSSQAKTQCYFVDACRETPLELLRARADDGLVLKDTTALSFPPRDAPILLASPDGEQALAPPNEVSYFTGALLDCLRGLGSAVQDGGGWRVDTHRLKHALQETMARRQTSDGRRLSCTVTGYGQFTTRLHRLPGPPRVMVTVGCVPGQHTAAARLSAERAGQVICERAQPDGTPWEIELEPDKYDFRARFAPPAPPHALCKDVIVYPPSIPVSISVP